MKFKVGEIYKDRGGREYRFIAFVPEARVAERSVFMELKEGAIHAKYSDGSLYKGKQHNFDIIPPEKKTRKLYPALYKSDGCQSYYTDYLHETCPEDAIRLITEWAPVIIEVEDD